MKISSLLCSKRLITCIALMYSLTLVAQDGGWDATLFSDGKAAMDEILEDIPKLKAFHSKAYGYVIFPKITRGGPDVRGTVGQGVVYRGRSVVGSANLRQTSFKLTGGEREYRELIYFKDKQSFEDFRNGKLKFDHLATALPLSEGVVPKPVYQNGISVFTHVKGGGMHEAQVAGQLFTFVSK